jgi:hypothetical protein
MGRATGRPHGCAKSMGGRSVEAGRLEEGLRHFLESIVLQVNSDLGLESETGGDDARTDEAHSEARHHEAVDRRMAATFRGFADEGS